MGSEEAPKSPESEVTSMSFEETELTLGLPGEGRSSAAAAVKCSTKRVFVETGTVVDLNVAVCKSGAGESPPAKAQVVGWPPVRSCRKKTLNESFKYVKVAMDGAPYLRKVNLQGYSDYHRLFKDLEQLFNCSIIGANGEESKVMEWVKRMEYVTTYEDKDSDWMLVGDVPWKMFIESCKRIRLMKCSEAAVLNLGNYIATHEQ
ncbi:indole-3-acetic acid inducible 14, SOLITARY ROOT [Hibiscus trionum]|uniref:Auxin-responsive protein n=1 Tax=Hibiscus trionum TaxID=183268 RepID=A0A9W7I200_HIBTR|nr:indole-3-acetic acid inducible 14, SOLITARY ROOT [Hibiscus trionum]